MSYNTKDNTSEVMAQVEMMAMMREILESQRYLMMRLSDENAGVKMLKVVEREDAPVPTESPLADPLGAQTRKQTKPLSMYIPLNEVEATKSRLQACTKPSEWARQGVYPLYENGDITYETIHSKNFIEATIPYCTNMKRANYNNLRQALYRLKYPRW